MVPGANGSRRHQSVLAGFAGRIYNGAAIGKNKKRKAARAFQEDGMPGLIRTRQIIPQPGLLNKPARNGTHGVRLQ